jgi:cytochrome P450
VWRQRRWPRSSAGRKAVLLTWGNVCDAEQAAHAENLVAYWNYCQALVAARHAELLDDLPGDLVALQRDGAEITDHEIASFCYSLLTAGHETTTNLIANGLLALLRHPEAWTALVANTGTGSATSRIKTGQRIRVNGTSGEVTFPQ